MKDFISLDVQSDLGKKQILEILSRELPEFTWRSGESDAQGGYITGRSSDSVQIQCWTSERPLSLSISFRSAKGDQARRTDLAHRFVDHLAPLLGNIVQRKAP